MTKVPIKSKTRPVKLTTHRKGRRTLITAKAKGAGGVTLGSRGAARAMARLADATSDDA